jgi:hypothetical protein
MYHLLTGQRPQDGYQLDAASEGYVNAPIIQGIIAAYCQYDPHARPTMEEVLRMLRGEVWADVQAGRRQRQGLAAACVIGLALLIAVAD